MINIKRKDFVSVNKNRNNLFTKKINEISTSFDFLSKVNFAIDFKAFKLILIGSAIIGFFIGILLKSLSIGIVLAICIPLLEIEVLFYLEKEVSNFVEGSIIKHANLIRNSYLHTFDVKDSIVSNIKRFESPVKELFEEFKTEVEVYHFSVEESLSRLPLKIKSKSLEEVTEQLILCNKDKSNINAYVATTEQLNDRLDFLQQWSLTKKAMLEDYISGLILVNFILGAMVFALKDISTAFFENQYSKIIIAVYLLILFITSVFAFKDINKEI